MPREGSNSISWISETVACVLYSSLHDFPALALPRECLSFCVKPTLNCCHHGYVYYCWLLEPRGKVLQCGKLNFWNTAMTMCDVSHMYYEIEDDVIMDVGLNNGWTPNLRSQQNDGNEVNTKHQMCYNVLCRVKHENTVHLNGATVHLKRNWNLLISIEVRSFKLLVEDEHYQNVACHCCFFSIQLMSNHILQPTLWNQLSIWQFST